MTKIKLSLIAISLLSMGTMAQADVDLKTTGQVALYYQTQDNSGDADLFDKGANSRANAGLQLNVNGDLGNDFGLGLQGTMLGTLGLENNTVGASMQTAQTNDLNGASLTKAYITKKIANTTLKLGRQELPKNLSPLAFSEGWNVFKNTFDAALAINTDIPDTTVVGAYVANGNGALVKSPGLVDLGAYNKIGKSGAYMLTVANKSNTAIKPTVSYYQLPNTGVSAVWADAQIDAGLPVKFALQGGQLMTDAEDTSSYGLKASGKAGIADLTLAYTNVGDGGNAIQNVGTGVKTPLYTQMILNQGAIKRDNDTVMLKAVAPVGPGKLIAQYATTKDNSDAESDYNELDVIYKFKALGTNMLAAYVMQDIDGKDKNNVLRVWTRYNF